MKKPFTRYATIASIALSLILLGYFLYPALSSFTGPLSDLPFYLGAPQPYSYILDTNGTHTFAWNGTTGYNTQISTNASDVINTAIDGLTAGRTWQESICINGNITLTHSIALHYDDDFTIIDTTRARLYLADSANCHVFDCQGSPKSALTDIVLRTGYINGNEAGQTQNCSIVFFNATRRSAVYATAQWAYPQFAGLETDGWANATASRYTVECVFDHLRIYYSDWYGMYIDGTHDCQFLFPYIQEIDADGIYAVSGTNYYLHPHCYDCNEETGQGGFRIESHNNQIEYLHGDTGNRHNLYVTGNNNTIRDPFCFSASQSSDNVYDEIRISGDWNKVLGGITTGATGSTQSKYGLNLVATAENCTVIGFSAYGSQTAQILDAGSSNEIHVSWNGTSYIS